MSYDYSAAKNKHPKIINKQYLYTFAEPSEHYSNDVPIENEQRLFGNTPSMRNKFRDIADRLRHLEQ